MAIKCIHVRTYTYTSFVCIGLMCECISYVHASCHPQRAGTWHGAVFSEEEPDLNNELEISVRFSTFSDCRHICVSTLFNKILS